MKNNNNEQTLDAVVYSREGKKTETIALPAEVFGRRFNADLVHQVVTAMQSNARQGTAHAKDRSEVRGGGKKPWKQKGTGRARHGSSRSPIWRHGGVTHGPRNDKDYTKGTTKKMRAGALAALLSRKFGDGKVLFLSDLAFEAPKTKDARVTLDTLGTIESYAEVATRRTNAVYIILPEANAAVKKSFANFGNVMVGTVRTLNPLDLLTYKYLVVVDPAASVPAMSARCN